MKKILNICLILAMIIVMLPACDIVDEPYLVPAGSSGPAPEVKVRKVLLEDFTGQKCINCPEAATVINNLKVVYGEQLVVISLHAGVYSVPEDEGDFTADFRTEEGTALNDYFSIQGYPMGMVNRTEFGGMRTLLKDSWEAAVDYQVHLDQQAEITITPDYNFETRKLDCKLDTEFITDMDGTFNICAFIIESNIISPQLTKTGVDTNYVHNHMLRGSMNGTWGDPVGNDGGAVGGITVTNNCTMTLSQEWDASNCAIVAFIYNTESNEIIQAQEKVVAE